MGNAAQGRAADVGIERSRSLFERQHHIPSPVVAFEEAPVLVPACAVSSNPECRGPIDPGPRHSLLFDRAGSDVVGEDSAPSISYKGPADIQPAGRRR